MEKQLYPLKIDPDFASLIPPLQDTELSILTDSILANGCEMPLVVWNGTVVDGHNRYRICHENGISFAVEEKMFESREAAKIWIIRNQLGRRNLSDFQKCELVLPLEELLKAEAEKRMQLGKSQLSDPVPNLAQGQMRTRDALATMAGVSHGTFDKARKLIDSADEDTKSRLRRGEMSIHRAYTELKQADAKRNEPVSPDKPALEKGRQEMQTVSLLKKPVFDRYEPPKYMKPIPFDPVVHDASAPTPDEELNTTVPEEESATDAVGAVIQTFLMALDDALDRLDYRCMEQALQMVRDAGQKAEQTVQKHFIDMEVHTK